VELELDVYWVSVAGRDPVREIRVAADRLHLLHVKDLAPGAEPREVPAGEGTLDIAAIIEAGRAAGVEWYVTEQVESDDPLQDIAAAARYLASLAISDDRPGIVG
jgi:sugar phosphate isomerase/epimerase